LDGVGGSCSQKITWIEAIALVFGASWFLTVWQRSSWWERLTGMWYFFCMVCVRKKVTHQNFTMVCTTRYLNLYVPFVSSVEILPRLQMVIFWRSPLYYYLALEIAKDLRYDTILYVAPRPAHRTIRYMQTTGISPPGLLRMIRIVLYLTPPDTLSRHALLTHSTIQYSGLHQKSTTYDTK